MINRKHLRRAAKLATKVSPIPIPDIVKEQLEGTTDKMSELTEKIDKLQKSLDTIIEIFEMEPIVIDGSDDDNNEPAPLVGNPIFNADDGGLFQASSRHKPEEH